MNTSYSDSTKETQQEAIAECTTLREELKAARYGRAREMGGGMLMVFDWHETRTQAAAAIPADSPVRQFVIARYGEPKTKGGE